METMLPCPFCGSSHVELEYWCGWQVSCEKCSASGPFVASEEANGVHGSQVKRVERQAAAVTAWNKRAKSAASLDARVLDLAAALSDEAEAIRQLATSDE